MRCANPDTALQLRKARHEDVPRVVEVEVEQNEVGEPRGVVNVPRLQPNSRRLGNQQSRNMAWSPVDDGQALAFTLKPTMMSTLPSDASNVAPLAMI